MIDHLHPQRLAYNEVEWCTIKLKLLFEKVCKNSIFLVNGGGFQEYDIDYYKSLIDGGNVDTSIFGTGKFFKEHAKVKKENIYSNIDDMLGKSLKPEEE